MKIVTKLLSFGLALVLSMTTLMPSAAMATSPSLNEQQQVYILSSLSNQISDPASQMKTNITKVLSDATIKSYIGDWEVAWGPVVVRASDNANSPINSMYVAKKSGSDKYVVAVAGTLSLENWKDQTLNVKEQVAHVCQTTTVQNAWARGQALAVHGLVYSLKEGLLKDLGFTVDSAAGIAEAYRIES